MNKILASIFSITILAGCVFMPRGSKMDPLTLAINNDCNSTVTAYFPYTFVGLSGVKILPNATYSDTVAFRRPPNIESNDNHVIHLLASLGDSLIIIQHANEYKETYTVRDFVAKAEKQMGKSGRGAWTLTLCPTTP